MCMHGLTLSALPQDVTSQEDDRLIGRAFVSAATLTTLQGSISATLMSPQLELVCVHTRSHLNFAHSCPIFHASGQLVLRQPGSRARGQVITACVDGPLCQQQHHDRIHHRHVDVPLLELVYVHSKSPSCPAHLVATRYFPVFTDSTNAPYQLASPGRSLYMGTIGG